LIDLTIAPRCWDQVSVNGGTPIVSLQECSRTTKSSIVKLRLSSVTDTLTVVVRPSTPTNVPAGIWNNCKLCSPLSQPAGVF
jgi:hypothetical protein